MTYSCVPWLIHMCVPWLIHMCDTTPSSHSPPRTSQLPYLSVINSVWRDSFTGVPWLIHMCDMTCSSDQCPRITQLHYLSVINSGWSDVTHSYVCHDSSICVTWLLHHIRPLAHHSCLIAQRCVLCDTTHSYVCHDLFMCAMTHSYVCTMTHSYV